MNNSETHGEGQNEHHGNAVSSYFRSDVITKKPRGKCRPGRLGGEFLENSLTRITKIYSVFGTTQNGS